MNIIEIMCLWSMCRVTRMDRVNHDVRRITAITRELAVAGQAEQNAEMIWTYKENG